MANGAAEHAAFRTYAGETRFRVLGAVSVSHFLNDLMQSLIVSIYPLLKAGFNLSFAQVGLITLTYQVCASILQPLVGMYTAAHPARAHLFEILLSGEHQQLLHLLSDREISRAGALGIEP
jgi:predicted MFS family arabinose efflux permease